MAPKHWTILIVPPGNESTRTVVMSARARRALVGAAGALGLLVTSAVVILLVPWTTPGGRLVATENARLRARLTQIDKGLVALSDTLAAIGVRDQQLREMAGLPVDSGVTTAAQSGAPGKQDGAVLASIAGAAPFPRPFAARLDFAGRADIEGLMRRATRLSASLRAVSDTLVRSFEKLARTPSIMPTAGWLSSHYAASRFHPVLHQNRAHEGIDLGAPNGSPIVAPASGTVKSVSFESGYGNTFELDHGDGIVTRFAHCSRIVVHVGQAVTRGQLIATVGNTGLSTGPHLHYEVHVKGQAVDPLRYVVQQRNADGIVDAEKEGRSP